VKEGGKPASRVKREGKTTRRSAKESEKSRRGGGVVGDVARVRCTILLESAVDRKFFGTNGKVFEKGFDGDGGSGECPGAPD